MRQKQKRRAIDTMVPPIAINTLAYHGYDLSTALREISDLGASYVEPAYIQSYYDDMDESWFDEENARAVRGLLSQYGLKSVAVAAHMDIGATNAVMRFAERMEFAREVGARLVITNATQKSAEILFYNNIQKLADRAEQLGLIIALENPGDGCNSLLSSGECAASVIEKIGYDSVKLNYDFSNVFSYSKGKRRPEDDMNYALPHIAHLHLKNIRPENDEWVFTDLASGEIDYRRILSTLVQQSSIVPMSIELPLRFGYDSTFDFKRSASGGPPPPVDRIRNMLKSSLEYVQGRLALQR
ncbi:MAG: sugar phosphate isomerase/epimerase family protein [Planctomycetota bacterium]|jgi:sugar phosphate isomerase/epimerase